MLDGIHNILKMAGEEVEPVANIIEECGGKIIKDKMNCSGRKINKCCNAINFVKDAWI